MSVFDAAFDLSGFARLRPAPQGCRVGERSAGSVLAVVPLVLTQRLAQMGLIPDKPAVEEVAAKVLAPVDTDRPERLISVDWPSILSSSYPIAHEHTNCASLLRMGTQVPPRTRNYPTGAIFPWGNLIMWAFLVQPCPNPAPTLLALRVGRARHFDRSAVASISDQALRRRFLAGDRGVALSDQIPEHARVR